MSRHSLAVPLSIIALMLVAIVLVLRPFEHQSYQAWAQGVQCTYGATGAAYPCTTATARFATDTAIAAGTAGLPVPTANAANASPTNTVATAATGDTTGATRTATTTATTTGTPPTTTATGQATATFAPSETRGPTAVLATATPVNGAVACLPGSTVEIKGRGPRNTSLLLFFGGRAVGGGVSDANGNYRLQMTVGAERAAFYPVQVRVRGTQQLVRELTCLVPYFTPTPTRARRSPLN